MCGARPLTASRLSWPRLRRSRPARIGVTAASQGVGSGSGSGAPLGTAWILPHIGTRIIGHNLDWKQGVNAGCCGSASSARSWRPLTTSGLLDFFAPHCFGGGVEVTEAHDERCPACAQGRCGQRDETLSGRARRRNRANRGVPSVDRVLIAAVVRSSDSTDVRYRSSERSRSPPNESQDHLGE